MGAAQAPSTAPEEVRAPPAKEEAYIAWRATTDLRAPYRVAPEFLRGTKLDAEFDADEAPLIVFINARSGGRVGPELAGVLARALGRSQVFDLSVPEQRPDVVLRRMWANFEQQEAAGNARAALVRARLRILACGGDGTVAGIRTGVQQLGLEPQPPVAIMPLGTGNDLSRTFSWGAEFVHGWIRGQASVYSTLKRIADAPAVNLDCWRLRLLLPDTSYKPAKTYAMEEVAAAAGQQLQLDGSGSKQRLGQQAQQQPLGQLGGDCAGEGGQQVLMEGLFWNYFSVGADAQAAYRFHHLRDGHPALAGSRLANQFWYSAFSCTSGWFCGTLPSVSRLTRVEVLLPGAGSWSELAVPPSVKALVLVNLQSYGGGRNIWGGAPGKRPGKWRQPSVADGLMEVVGFHSGYHALAVMGSGAKLANGKRLAQVAGIRLALQDPLPRPDGEPGQVFMQLDGEPWMQPVPAGEDGGRRVMLEVVNLGQSRVLANSGGAPDKHPTKTFTKMLSEQQAAAYLAAAPADGRQPLEAAAARPALTPSREAERGEAGGRQQQELRQAHAGDGAAAGRGMLQMQVLAPAAAGAAAAAAPKPPAQPPLLQDLDSPRARLVATDGGAPCSITPGASPDAAAAAAAAAAPRRSLDAEIGAAAACSSREGSTASSSDRDVLAPITPGAVAVIEAVPTPGSAATAAARAGGGGGAGKAGGAGGKGGAKGGVAASASAPAQGKQVQLAQAAAQHKAVRQ